MIELLTAHAEAACASAAPALVPIARRFHDIGAIAVAGDCFAAAASAVASDHPRYRHLACEYRRQCDAPMSPILDTVEAPLTERQREIASLAASGLTSKEIGARLHLSVRTVDNHLGTVYDILAIGGRAELAAMFPTTALWT